VDDLLDAALAQVSVVASVEEEKQPDINRSRHHWPPNVGKSTLLNRMVGEERSIVSPIPGTTMDNVDLEITRDGRAYRFVDTAGIRRKVKPPLVAKSFSCLVIAPPFARRPAVTPCSPSRREAPGHQRSKAAAGHDHAKLFRH